MSERPFCEKRVFGYGRLIGGERCSNRAKAEYNGKWRCGVHSPEAVLKRAVKREKRYQEYVRKSNLRGEHHDYRAACERAFHSPDGRTIATEDIAPELFWRMFDTLFYYQDTFCEGFCKDAPPGFTSPNMEIDCSGCKARALLSSLKIQEPENG